MFLYFAATNNCWFYNLKLTLINNTKSNNYYED